MSQMDLSQFYGSRKMKAWLLQQGYLVNRKKVRRLMRLMRLDQPIYRMSYYTTENTVKSLLDTRSILYSISKSPIIFFATACEFIR